MGTARLTNGLMTMVSDWAESKNYDYETKSGLRTGAPGDCYTYLYFPRPFPLKATITSATLRFYTQAFSQTGSKSINVTRVKQAINFSKVTFVTKPTSFYGAGPTITKTGPLGTTEWVVDVTAQMQSISNGDAWYGWRLTGTFNPVVYVFGPTYANSAVRPSLEVQWSDSPQKPDGLAPSGGRAVNTAKPVVRANYIDVSGSTTLSAVRVQTGPTAAALLANTPAWDSETVSASAPELDLNQTSFPGLTDGQVVYWRIALTDGAGLTSVWSDPATFKRDAHGTLTVNNPTAGTPTVTDVTPPILWTFTGETQSAFQIGVEESYDATRPTAKRSSWNSGKITGTQTAYTLPPGVLTTAGRNYDITVRVWDAKARESVAGDPAYVQVVRTFSFAPSASVPGVTDLSVVADAYRPKATLTWTRSAAPDAFNIVRNGRVIASGLLPQDLFVSGTTYRYVDQTPSPQRSLSYMVQAVQNKVASANNTVRPAQIRSVGVWLRDLTSGDEICIGGKDARPFTLAETTAVVEPIADGAPKVLITQAQGLLEGRIEGPLLGSGIPGQTDEGMRAAYLRMRNTAGRKFYLTTGDYTFAVVVKGFTYEQRTDVAHEKIFRVGFDFFQQDSLDGLA